MPRILSELRSTGSAVLLLLLLVALCGCGTLSLGTDTTAAAPTTPTYSPPSSTPATPSDLAGRASAGPGTVIGAHIYLFAASTTGWGAPSLSLITPGGPGVLTDSLGSYVTTDSNGGFSLSGLYGCTPGSLVYIVAEGGAPPGGSFNPGLALLSTFGPCPAAGTFAGQIGFVNINQVSTVVSVFALSGFMTDIAHVSSGPSGNARAGLSNAFAAVGNLEDLGSGSVLAATTSGNGVIPQATINTLANILVPCSNDASACPALFALAHSLSGAVPTDTAQAMLFLAGNPGANVSALFALAAAQPFRPALGSAPNDWTVGITYFAENLAGAYFPAVDAAGNLWVPGYANNTLSEFSPLGALLSGSSGFTGGGLSQPVSVAIDTAGNPWVASFGATPGTPSLAEFAPNGNPITSNGFSCGTACSMLAVDGNNNLWVSGAPQVAVIRNSGVMLSQFLTAAATPSGVVVDSQGHGWVVSSGRTLSRLTLPAQMVQFPQAVTSASPELNGLALDAGDSLWVTSPRNNALGKFSPAGSTLSPATGFSGGGLHGPVGVAVDGGGRVWVANRDGSSVSSFLPDGTAVSPLAGYAPAGLQNPRGIAIDPSGNVWLSNFTGNSVTELLGAATPVATPMLPSNHGQRP